MTTAGVTAQGFLQPTADEISQSISDGVRGAINPGLDTSPDQPLGQFISIFASKLADAYGVVATAYNALNPDAAEDQLLVNDCALTGTRPQVATFGSVTLNITATGALTIPTGAKCGVTGQPANQWVYQGAPFGVTGAGTYPLTFQATAAGAIPALANTITTILTPVSGWTAVTNPLDAVEGLNADTNTTLRQKREAELQGQGGGDVDAIRAAVLKVPGVLQAFVFENTDRFADVNGLPSNSFRVALWDGASPAASNSSIAQAIWNARGSCSRSFGASSGTATDSQGNSQTVFFDRVTQVPIYIVCTTTPGTLSTAQTTAIKAALVAYATANFQIDQAVIALALRSAALIAGIDTDVPVFQLGTTPSPSGTTNIPISALQIPTLVSTNILVNGV